jgi:membrane protease YdiL (CAAX protease family)
VRVTSLTCKSSYHPPDTPATRTRCAPQAMCSQPLDLGSTGPYSASMRIAHPARCVAAIVLTAAMTFHWIPAYWWHHVGLLFERFSDPWSYRLSSLAFAILLTVWAPRTFGLTCARTWATRRVVVIVGGGMTAVAIVGMLFIRVPFYGGSSAMYLCVPLMEELLFRGFLFAVLDDAFPRKWNVGRFRISSATVITAIAFGLWHLGGLRVPPNGFILFQVIYTTIAGLLFGIMREKTGSIWAPWSVHFVINAWAVTVPGLWALVGDGH